MNEKKSIYPLGKFEINAFPKPNDIPCLITDEELIKLRKHELKWATSDYGIMELAPNDPTEENKQKSYRVRIAELKKLLAESDYKAIKFAEGIISEADYALDKAKRQAWRDEINLLEGMLK